MVSFTPNGRDGVRKGCGGKDEENQPGNRIDFVGRSEWNRVVASSCLDEAGPVQRASQHERTSKHDRAVPGFDDSCPDA